MAEPRISNQSAGTFDAAVWIGEGDGLLASARTARATWHCKRRRFVGLIAMRQSRMRKATAWNELTGLPKASMLLLGYAVEMFLKAGLARVYQGCREEMFDRDVRQRFSHDLSAIAAEVDLPFLDAVRCDLDRLREYVLADARYPARPVAGGRYEDAANAVTDEMWDWRRFRRLCALARDIRAHVSSIDHDHRHTALFRSYRIGDDGYVMFRVGGNLRPRITYHVGADRGDAKPMSPVQLRELFDQPKDHVIQHYWDMATIVEDGAKRTFVRSEPGG